MPALADLYRVLNGIAEVHVIGQNLSGNQLLAEDFDPPFSILDDSALQVSFGANIEIVPSLVVVDASGETARVLEGFVKQEWLQVIVDWVQPLGNPAPDLDWSSFPDWRPGCGSLSVDPANEPRLRALQEGSPMRARQISVGSQDDVAEFMFDQGFSDGLPLIPPTPERVLTMLEGCSRDPQEVLAVMPPNMGEVTVEKAAINAVMAGCRPEYLPVVIAAVEAVIDEAYNIHGVMATTMGASPVMVVNGPVRHTLGMNMGMGALGQGNRANATIGRALRLIIRNVGGARPGETERSTLGNPMKFSLCFAEWEERNPWSPLHVERGFKPEDSVITLFTMTSGPNLIVDQDSRSAAALAGTLGQTMASIFNAKAYLATDCLLVIVPEHVNTFVRDGYDKAAIRQRIQEVTRHPLRELIADQLSGAGVKPEAAAKMDAERLDTPVAKFKSDEDIHIVVAGGEAGKFSGLFHGWLTGEMGSVPVSRKID